MDYRKNINDVFKDVKSSKEGLTDNEANERLIKEGPNKIESAKKSSAFMKFLSQFNNIMIIILIIAAIVSFVVSYLENESIWDGIIILVIVFLNAIMGYLQERKADMAIDALKKMAIPYIKVRRNNIIKDISTEDLVVGDIIILKNGDYVPADARVIESVALQVDESPLTGESVPIDKDTDAIDHDVSLSERYNMIYSGCMVVYGRGEAVVVNTGYQTELGKIANKLETTKKEITPLQKKMEEISKFLTGIIIAIIIIMIIMGIFQGFSFIKIFMLSISLAVAAIPEGLPAVITVALSFGMESLAKKKAIIRKMNSVETLGSTEIICSDKTGTITENKMTVKELYFNGKIYDSVPDDKDFEHMKNALILCNDVVNSNGNLIGNPTEMAIYKFLNNNNIDINEEKKNCPRVDEKPFDSKRKMMSTINEVNNERYVFNKGSLEYVLRICSKYYDDGKEKSLTNEAKKEILELEKKEASKAYRLIALAYKKDDGKDIEKDLVFLGFIGIIDPPRKSVKKSIQKCFSAGITPIMITGDSLNTAIAIGKDIGILKSDDEAILGSELDNISDEELIKRVNKYRVYARVSPEHKYRIINAWKANNKIVAMTGDGVNDAPAIKSAHIGISMGINGTEVTKGASDVILVDDSFSTIVDAVEEGRRIYDNIKNVILYLLTANITEILIVFVAMLFGTEIFLPIHLLWINLVTDALPAICLTFEKADDDIMKHSDNNNRKTFFSKSMIAQISIFSSIKALVILLAYFFVNNLSDSTVASTMAFITLIIMELLYAINCRNLKHTLLNKNLFSNKYMNISLLVIVLIQVILFISPLRSLFKIADVDLIYIIYALVIGVIVFILDEFFKVWIHKKFNK